MRLDTAVPAEVLRAAHTLREFAATRDTSDRWAVYGLGPVHGRDAEIIALQTDLREAQIEIKLLQAKLELADALLNKERNFTK